MTEALHILGHEHVYHGWTLLSDPSSLAQWTTGIHAKYTPPAPPSTAGAQPLTKPDFDSLLGQYSAVSGDFPCIAFASELIQTYPTARVVLVQRSPIPWRASVTSEILAPQFALSNAVFGHLDPLFAGKILRFYKAAYRGFFGARDRDGIEANLERRYVEYHELVRRVTWPRERLLEFRLEDGWGPLCEHLGVDVPRDVAFPWLNERGMVGKVLWRHKVRSAGHVVVNLAVGVVFVAVLWRVVVG